MVEKNQLLAAWPELLIIRWSNKAQGGAPSDLIHVCVSWEQKATIWDDPELNMINMPQTRRNKDDKFENLLGSWQLASKFGCTFITDDHPMR